MDFKLGDQFRIRNPHGPALLVMAPRAMTRSEAGEYGLWMNALDAAGAAAGANGLNVSLDAQLVTDIKAIASAAKGALSPVATAAAPAK